MLGTRERAEVAVPQLSDLLLALRRLDQRLAHAVAAQETLGAAPVDDELRGLYIDEAEVRRLLGREPGQVPWSLLSTGDDGAEPELKPELLDIPWLRTAFGLDVFDAELVLVALAPEVDLRYERIYAFLQDDITRRRPTVELALNLLCCCAEAKLAGRTHLAADSPLIRSGIVRLVAEPEQIEPPLLARYLKVDDQVVSMLLGQPGLDARLARYATLTSGPGPHPDQPPPLPPALLSHAARSVANGQPLRLYFRGQPGVGKIDAVRELARSLRLDLLTVSLEQALGDGADLRELVRLALRDAKFRPAVLCLAGLDALQAEPTAGAGAGAGALDAVLTSLTDDPRLCVLTGSLPWEPVVSGPLGVVTIDFPAGGYPERRDRWRRALTKSGVPVRQADLDLLADRFRLTPRQIDDAAATAINTAAVTADSHPAGPDLTGLTAAARALAGHGMTAVASKVTTTATWDDLVLPTDVLAQLRELCDRVTARERVLGDWGLAARLPLGRGVAALFTGPPGTGKTMGAGIVAGELGLDLYRIDLSRIVSKYIGETEKNLERVFTAAHDANAVLLFDEADALFGKRSAVHDAHDRYANVEVAYLLQKMEEYEGVAILATNLQDNLDDAFARRLAFTIGFPFPDEACRRRIWAILWPPQTPVANDLDLDLLARELKLSGGSIRNVGVAAAFLGAGDGGQVAMRHVLHAARRECHKIGRVFPEGLASYVR